MCIRDRFIMWIMNLFISDSEIGSGTGGGSQDMGLGLESAEPSWFALFMEQVMKYLVVVILAVGAVFVLYKLGKMSVRLWRRVSEWARRFAQGVKEMCIRDSCTTLTLRCGCRAR